MRALSLCGRLLTNPVRNKAYIVKLNNYADPKTKQRGCKGHVISFPQLNAAGAHPSVNSAMPLPPAGLADVLRIIFVGDRDPTVKQLSKIFSVRAADVRDSIRQWQANGHPGYTGSWSEENMNAIAACEGDVTSLIESCVSRASDADDACSVFNSASLADPLDPVVPLRSARGDDSVAPKPHSGSLDAALAKYTPDSHAAAIAAFAAANNVNVDDSTMAAFAKASASDVVASASAASSDLPAPGNGTVDAVLPTGPVLPDLTDSTVPSCDEMRALAADILSRLVPDDGSAGPCDPSESDGDEDQPCSETLAEFYSKLSAAGDDDHLYFPGGDSADGGGDDSVLLQRAGMMNMNGVGSDMSAAMKRAVDSALKVTHDEKPVDQFADPTFWPNAFPVLFPYGCGGAIATSRPTHITLREWVRHMLAYHDGRFRKDPSFLYVAFAILQIQERLTLSRVLYKKVFTAGATSAINAPTSAQLKATLELMQSSKTLFGLGPDADAIRQMLTNTSIIGSQLKGSIYERAACRNELLGMVTMKGLPNLFITVNPSDIHNPIISFWDSASGDPMGQFELATLDGDFPTEARRAQLVAKDPVLPARAFDTVINSFLKAFLGFEKPVDSGESVLPKGKLLNPTLFTGANSRGLKGFYGTVECQARGSLHLHLLIWLEGLPTSEGNSCPSPLTRFALLPYLVRSSSELAARIKIASATVAADLLVSTRAAARVAAGLPPRKSSLSLSTNFFRDTCYAT
jgi:hypothetical protein